MSSRNQWRDLLIKPATSQCVDATEQAYQLDWIAALSEMQGKRLDAGIAAIAELLDAATNKGNAEDSVAVDICNLLAVLAGLSAQLSALSCSAHKAWLDIRGQVAQPAAAPALALVSQE